MKKMKVQIRCEIFKPSGKYYTTEFVVLDVPMCDDTEVPAQIYGYDTYALIKAHFANRFDEGFMVYPHHELLVPRLIKL